MSNPKIQFTDFDIAAIRLEYAKGNLDKKAWADARLCSPETIARIARGDTYRHRGGQQQHHAWGGLPAGQGSAAPQRTPTPPTFTQSSQPAPLTAALPDEPDDAALAASFARLQAALEAPTAEETQRARANALVDELRASAEGPTAKGGRHPNTESAPLLPTPDVSELD
jgi:hypothetical protein